MGEIESEALKQSRKLFDALAGVAQMRDFELLRAQVAVFNSVLGMKKKLRPTEVETFDALADKAERDLEHALANALRVRVEATILANRPHCRNRPSKVAEVAANLRALIAEVTALLSAVDVAASLAAVTSFENEMSLKPPEPPEQTFNLGR